MHYLLSEDYLMAVIPIMLDLQNKSIVVVGGGKIAKRRINSLLEAGAEITVVSPEILEDINDLSVKGKLTWKQKKVSTADFENAFLIIVATDDKSVNEFVIKHAPPNRLINSSFKAIDGNVHFPSHFKRGKLSIAISTNGASPLLAKKIKKDIASRYDENFEVYVDFLFEVRHILKKIDMSKHEKKRYLYEILEDHYHDTEHQKKLLDKLNSLPRFN